MSENATGHGILVGVDGSAQSDSAVRWAAREAVMRALPLTLMHVVTPVVVGWPMGPVQANIAEWQEENARAVIAASQKVLYASATEGELQQVRVEIRYAGALTALVDAAPNAWMVVVGSSGVGGVGRAVLGSVSGGLLHHARCPVTVVHDDARPSDPQAPVLLGIDGSPASEAATGFAFDEASRRGVDLVALHAWSDVGVFPILGEDWHSYEDQGHEALAERLAGWQEQYPDVHVHRRIVCDRPGRWLIDESQNAGLVVVGSRGRGGFTSMLLGSVSAAVARAAHAPVTVVRS
ncbi:universal stress protein [Mycolicibacterium hippocampi]|uniref:universal stress protein n=1 Tax=Mycolicibacterium hippocampi TaxID=659824 RepID=UPI003513652D